MDECRRYVPATPANVENRARVFDEIKYETLYLCDMGIAVQRSRLLLHSLNSRFDRL